MNRSEKNQVIYDSAKADFLNANYHQTIKKMDELRKQEGDQYDLLILQARAFAKLPDLQSAVGLINEVGTENLLAGDVTFVVSTLLAAKEFIPARKVAVGLNEQYVTALIDQIEVAEFEFRKHHHAEVLKLQRRLAYVGSHSADIQAKIVFEANQLPLKEYLAGVKAVLVDRAGWQVIKTQFLFELIGLKINTQVDFLWLDDEVHQIVPAELNVEDGVQPIVETINLAEEKYANENPIFAQQLTAEIYQLGNYLFPYAKEVITSPNFWIRIIKSHIAGDNPQAHNEKEMQMINWFEVIIRQEQRIKYM